MGLARTFQNIALFEHLTVLDNLMLGRHQHIHYGFAAAFVWRGRARNQELEHRRFVEEIVDFLELEQWRTLPVGLLPYGVQKRVELGRALAMEPKLLLLDEPVAGMNLEETEDTARYILDIRDELNVPIIMVEHDMGLVMDLADRVMVVDFGTPITTGTPDEVQRHPDVVRAYLGEEVPRDQSRHPDPRPRRGDAARRGAARQGHGHLARVDVGVVLGARPAGGPRVPGPRCRAR